MTTAVRERNTDQKAVPAESAILTMEQLFAKRPLRTKSCDVKDYGVTLLSELMGFERDELDSKAVQRLDDGKGGTKVIQDYRNYRARACVFSLCNPDGTKMFPEASAKDVELVSRLPAGVIDAMFDVVDELSALTKKRQDAVGKESSATTGTDSSSK